MAINPPKLDYKFKLDDKTSNKIIYREFLNVAKSLTLPEKLNFNIILDTFCTFLDLLYNTFVDSIFN